MRKAKSCDECSHQSYRSETDIRMICALGHAPRFYKPKNGNVYFDDWGWKRRCDDYKQGEHVYIINYPVYGQER